MRKRPPSSQARAVLQALLGQPLAWRYGYDLSKQLGLSSGTLYPVLIRLHARGLLEAKWIDADRAGRPPRHAYRLTAKGVAFTRALDEVRVSSSLASDQVLA
jgi:PadR family transcriptional regulator PadR